MQKQRRDRQDEGEPVAKLNLNDTDDSSDDEAQNDSKEQQMYQDLLKFMYGLVVLRSIALLANLVLSPVHNTPQITAAAFVSRLPGDSNDYHNFFSATQQLAEQLEVTLAEKQENPSAFRANYTKCILFGNQAFNHQKTFAIARDLIAESVKSAIAALGLKGEFDFIAPPVLTDWKEVLSQVRLPYTYTGFATFLGTVETHVSPMFGPASPGVLLQHEFDKYKFVIQDAAQATDAFQDAKFTKLVSEFSEFFVEPVERLSELLVAKGQIEIDSALRKKFILRTKEFKGFPVTSATLRFGMGKVVHGLKMAKYLYDADITETLPTKKDFASVATFFLPRPSESPSFRTNLWAYTGNAASWVRNEAIELEQLKRASAKRTNKTGTAGEASDSKEIRESKGALAYFKVNFSQLLDTLLKAMQKVVDDIGK
jgi:hypothetical protein